MNTRGTFNNGRAGSFTTALVARGELFSHFENLAWSVGKWKARKMPGKPQLDWQDIRFAWQENFVTTRLFCRETGLDRSYLQEKIRDEGWKLLRKPTIEDMHVRLLVLQWTDYARRDSERVKDLSERIKDRLVLKEMWFQLVKQTVANARFRRTRRRA